MKAYITLLSSEDYLPAVLVLNKTIKEVCIYPLICAITDTVASNKNILDILNNEEIKYEIIPELSYSKQAIDNITESNNKDELRLINTASKIALFSLTQYEKLTYIDADSYIIKNIDTLFDYPDGAMLWAGIEAITGLMVFSPANHCYEYYRDFILQTDASDGEFFGKLWFHVKTNKDYQIPMEYLCHTSDNKYYNNIQKNYSGFTCNDIKLFKLSNQDLINKNYPLYYLYGQTLLPLKEKYKI